MLRFNAGTVSFDACSRALTAFVCLSAATVAQAQTEPPACERRFSLQRVITQLTDYPRAVFAADVDGDGDVDVLSSSSADNKVAWYENVDGLGTFGPQQIIARTAAEAISVFAIDLDGDGDSDALSASLAADEIAWYENVDGQGTFGPKQVITDTADGARSVFAADLDGDGDADVLSASSDDDTVAWYENVDGHGTFGAARIITTAADWANAVLAADVDGDGDADVLSSAGTSNEIAWYENTDGRGAFGPPRIITTAVKFPNAIFTADVDGDGDIDVLSASGNDAKIAWYENVDGSGDFGPQQVLPSAAGVKRSVYAADLDGDGDVDVLSASSGDDGLSWHENTDGFGGFGPAQPIDTSRNYPQAVIASDVDGDGDMDVLCGWMRVDKVSWYVNETDCNGNGVNDGCDVELGTVLDCNGNHWPDECDIANGIHLDCNGNGIPDNCELDCNDNKIPDDCDIGVGASLDCNGNSVPDECDLAAGIGSDCNENANLDECDLGSGASFDCNGNAVLDECDLASGVSVDCNGNAIPDDCDIASGASGDCNFDGVPDDCQPNGDCNVNTVLDLCDIGAGTSEDCNFDFVPDECQPNGDCNANTVPDLCDIGAGTELDCNQNLSPDSCDIAAGTSLDDDGNGIPDECCQTPAPVFMLVGSRYLMLGSIGTPGVRSAIRVTFVDNDSYPVLNGQSLWVGQPRDYPEEDTSRPGLTFVGANLSCTPHYQDWSTINMLHVFGAEVVPRSTYAVQLIDERCAHWMDTNLSAPVLAVTGKLGDQWALFDDPWCMDPPGPCNPAQPDFNDLAASVGKFTASGSRCSGGVNGGLVCSGPSDCPGGSCDARAPIKGLAQLQPNVVLPDRSISFKDIAATVTSFLGVPYVDTVPDAAPCTCPSSVTCGATVCTSDLICAPGFCIDGYCTDKCGRCAP